MKNSEDEGEDRRSDVRPHPRPSLPSGAICPPLGSLELDPHGCCVDVVDLHASTCPRELNSNPTAPVLLPVFPDSPGVWTLAMFVLSSRPPVCCLTGVLPGLPCPRAPRSCPVGLDLMAQVRLRVKFFPQPKPSKLRSLTRCWFSSWYHTGLAERENIGRSVP